jgi:hypothetical protein
MPNRLQAQPHLPFVGENEEMLQNQANRYGRDRAKVIAKGIGAQMVRKGSNECLYKNERVVIKCARIATTKVAVSYKMLQHLDAVLGAFENSNGSYRIIRLSKKAYQANMKPTRSKGPSANRVGVVDRAVFDRRGVNVGGVPGMAMRTTTATVATLERTGKERSVSDLAQIDERNVGLYRVDEEHFTAQPIEAEDVQADFLRAESNLGPKVPIKIRERIAVALNLAAYGWFSYEFYTVAVFWSLSCVEMALRAKFGETHPGPLKLINRKSGISEAVAFFEVEERLKHGWRNGWRIEGLPTFNFSFRSLLEWAQEMDLLPAEATPKAIVALRNSMAHPSQFNWVLPPGNALDVFRLLIQILVKLWPK